MPAARIDGILNSVKTEAEKHGYDITFLSEDIGYGSYVEHCRYRKCDGVLLANAVFDKKSSGENLNGQYNIAFKEGDQEKIETALKNPKKPKRRM